jgi:hypothetical protein
MTIKYSLRFCLARTLITHIEVLQKDTGEEMTYRGASKDTGVEITKEIQNKVVGCLDHLTRQ